MPELAVCGARSRVIVGRVDAMVSVLAAAVEVTLVAQVLREGVEELPHAADVAARVVRALRVVVDVGDGPLRDRELLLARDGELDERDGTARAVVLDVVGERVPVRVRDDRARPVAVEVSADDVHPVVAGVDLAHVDLRPAQVVPVDLAARQLVVVDVGDASERVLVFAKSGRVVVERVPREVLEGGLPAEADYRRRVAEVPPAPGDGAVIGVEVAAGSLGEAALGAGAQQRRGGGDADAAPGEQLGQAVAPEWRLEPAVPTVP